MHDPVAVWYAISQAAAGSSKAQIPPGWAVRKREFNIERKGEYTRGMCVVDRRGTGEEGVDRTNSEELKSPSIEVVKKDWSAAAIQAQLQGKALPLVIVKSPGSEVLRKVLMERVFGIKV